jgi:hypothetical protein
MDYFRAILILTARKARINVKMAITLIGQSASERLLNEGFGCM